MENTTNPNPDNLSPTDFGENVANQVLDLIDAAFPETDDYNEALEAVLRLVNVMFMAK